MNKLSVEVRGQGDVVVFVHGLGGTANVFWPQVVALSDQYECRLVELPGSGDSPADENMTLDGVAERIAAEVFAGQPAHLVGHSLGTAVCQKIAARHPDLVRSLFLIGPVHAPAAAGRTGLKDRAAKARAEGMRSIADTIVQTALSETTRAERPEVAGFVRELLMRQRPDGYAATCEALAAVEGAPLADIRCPVGLITGAQDPTSPPAAVQAMTEALPNAAMTVLDNCGHWTTVERPAAVTEALQAFLRDQK